MRTRTSTTLLDDVWQALEEIGLTDRRDSGAERGWITAVSTSGAQLRILLRLPAELCREGAGMLAEVADALRALPVLNELALEVKPHRAPTDLGLAETPGSRWHELPVTTGLFDQCHQGWVVEGVQHRRADSSTDVIGTTGVLVRASIAEEEDTRRGAPKTPRGAA